MVNGPDEYEDDAKMVEGGGGADRVTIKTTFGMDKTAPTRMMGAKSGTVTNLDFRKKKKMKLDKELIGSRMMMNYLKFGGESHGS